MTTAMSAMAVKAMPTDSLRRRASTVSSARPAAATLRFSGALIQQHISVPGKRRAARIYPAAAFPFNRLHVSAMSATMAPPKTAEVKPPTKAGFHIHFGAGKLGMGLIFNGMVGSGVPFAIMQPPFEGDGDALLNDERVSVLINGKDVLPGGLAVVNKDTYPELKESMKKDRSMVLIHPGDEWDELISSATSFSCSIGPKVCDIIGPALEKNLEKMPLEMRPNLFACENDHGAVEKLGEKLKGRIEVVPCMVDRICSGREMVDGTIKVTTENPFEGTIIPLTPQPDDEDEEDGLPLPLGGGTVFVPRTERESDYMYERKIMTVNHMHTTLAFLSLVKHMEDNGSSPAEMVAGEGSCMSLPLIKWKANADPSKDIVWCWAVAQCLLLTSEHGLSTMMKSHKTSTIEELNNDLLRRAREKLDRFNSVEDSTARVLGAGVDLRYQGRLLPAYEAVQVLESLMETWPADNRYQKLLDLAGVTIQDVTKACKWLVEAAEPLADADREKYALEKAEPEPTYKQIISTMPKAAYAAEQTAEDWIEDKAQDIMGAVSGELEEIGEMVTRARDMSLDWVACHLETLGFKGVADWTQSVEQSFEDKPHGATEVEGKEVQTPPWMVSMEEKKKYDQ